jgi:hypothetical protein
MSLKAMSVSKLNALKREVESAIQTKVTERRQEIESELSRLARFDGSRDAKVVRAGARGLVVVKVGKKSDKSLMAESPKASTPKQPKQPKKIRKATKTRKPANNVTADFSILPTAKHVDALPVEALPVEALPIEAREQQPHPVASIHDKDMPTEVSVAA